MYLNYFSETPNRNVQIKVNTLPLKQIYCIPNSSFSHHTELESQQVYLVLFMNCLDYNLIIAQAKTNTK